MKFIVETSARHVHVTQETLEILFGKGHELTHKKDLSQPGQFACEERVTVVGPKKSLERVSILGPVRNADQVELSLSDARSIGVAAPIRESGDVAGSAPCKLVGPCGEVELTEGVIAAKRHIHATPEDAEKLGVKYTYNVLSDFKDIKLDNSELTVILSNLLNNAIEATSSIDKKEVEINISEDEKYYKIEVKNYTENLKSENLTQIFKVGYTTKGEGRGYGLANVKAIVDKYKGKIQMSLEENIVNISIIFLR